ncbi:carbohydrate-binding protein [Thraustotheca clavata]|uniref:Carbohydrate-binding protein n=1 Tax=Thraustotheca clavata TaxID=74557 RepID=A0A1V9ZA40_9STRA|nr:carbohydrate-binding protein [Thraustotheca clavata]
MKRVRVLERVVGVIVFIGVVCGILALCGVFKKSVTPTFDEDSNNATNATTLRPANCSAIAPGKRLIAYWNSEMSGCESLPAGVTHVVFSSALVASDGTVGTTFQSSDDATNACIAALHKRCMYVFAGIRSSNTTDIINASPAVLVDGVTNLFNKFDFDGIAIHDESDKTSNYTTDGALAYMTALSSALQPLNASLIYDALMFEADPVTCLERKCFPAGMEALVDWVNVYAFDAAKDEADAAVIYSAALSDNGIFSEWATAMRNQTKVALVVTSAGGASWGPDLSNTTIANLTKYAETLGGTGIYTASNDMYTDYPIINLVLNTLDGFVSVHTAPPTQVPAPPKATKAQTVFCHSGISYSVKSGDTAFSIVTSICKKTTKTKCSRDGIWLYRTNSLDLCPSDLATGDKVTVCCGVN